VRFRAIAHLLVAELLGVEAFDRPIFHGGDDATLEMRLFSPSGLERELQAAGFSRIRFIDAPCPRFGIFWPEPWPVPIVARRAADSDAHR